MGLLVKKLPGFGIDLTNKKPVMSKWFSSGKLLVWFAILLRPCSQYDGFFVYVYLGSVSPPSFLVNMMKMPELSVVVKRDMYQLQRA